jgi:hypothetical protein
MLRAASLPIAALSLAVVLTACDDNMVPKGVGLAAPSVAAAIDARIQPQVVPFTLLTGFSCPALQPFTTAFDLVVQERLGRDLFLDQVSLHFLDGTNLGASPMVLPRADLNRLFTSTLVNARATRFFRFAPQFGCGIGVPQVLIVEAFFLDRFNTRLTSTARATIQ